MDDEVYKLLKNREIYNILDGDTHFTSKVNGGDLSMPYLSGPKLVTINNRFGNPVTYESCSRWRYVEMLLEHCIRKGTALDLLAYLFSVERFEDELKGMDAGEAKTRHREIVQGVVDHINGVLLLSGKELKQIGNTYIVAEVGDAPKIAAPAINKVNRDYIRSMADRAQDAIINGDYDSAMTKARTLLEETFIYAIEQKGVKVAKNGDIGGLYKQVRELYNMHTDKQVDKRINMLLSGLAKIVEAIAQMRNSCSDAHGIGAGRIAISDYHARLAVNSATNMADFILEVVAHADKK